MEFDEYDVLAASAATIILVSAASVALQCRRRRRRFWVRPSLVAKKKKKYSATDFMKDLILDDVDLLCLEYRSGAGFRNFFRMSTTEFENILALIAPRISRVDTRVPQIRTFSIHLN